MNFKRISALLLIASIALPLYASNGPKNQNPVVEEVEQPDIAVQNAAPLPFLPYDFPQNRRERLANYFWQHRRKILTTVATISIANGILGAIYESEGICNKIGGGIAWTVISGFGLLAICI